MKFAKLIELDEHQVLVTLDSEELDSGKVTYQIIEEVRHNGTSMSLKHGYKSEQKRNEMFASYNEEHANSLLSRALKFIE